MNQTVDKFSLTARWFHWISAAVILWAMISGLIISGFELSNTIEHAIGDFNVSITFLFIPVFFARLAYRCWHGVPDNPSLSRIQSQIAEISHWIIYGMVTVVLVSGVLMMDREFTVFHLFTVQPVITDEYLIQTFEVVHKYFSRILAFGILLHLFAVVKHHLSGVNLMSRMV